MLKHLEVFAKADDNTAAERGKEEQQREREDQEAGRGWGQGRGQVSSQRRFCLFFLSLVWCQHIVGTQQFSKATDSTERNTTTITK